eukprot:TRINITY_DN16106_c0_g1_i1.p1 TRINITY_DN16106_c0_g1~~TRINITY_DN16106_c0_g1_i1.p1  ORF type:complete len:204 (+),score=65.90 TRINITY_DN16106_c0_g1_i1:118-729(+)
MATKRPAEGELDKAAVAAEEDAPEKTPADKNTSSSSTAPATAPGQDAEETEVVKVNSSEDFWRVQLEAIYRRRNPHKLDGVPALLEKYKGKEAALYAKVCKTYFLDPKKLYADPKAWEEYETDTLEKVGEKNEESLPATGGGVPIANLFGCAGGLGPVSGPLFAAGKTPAKPGADNSDSDSEAGAPKAPAAPATEKPAECKTQ